MVIGLDSQDQLRPPFVKGHELVALSDVVDHEDGLAVAPDILAARLMKGRITRARCGYRATAAS